MDIWCLLSVCWLKKTMYLLSSDEFKTYDHSAYDIKVKIVIDFSYLNDIDLSLFFKSNIENFKG
jgi:hypothetical protein